MMLFEDLAVDIEEVRNDKGKARLFTLAPTVYVTHVVGYMIDAHAELFERYAEKRIRAAAGAKLNVFHDWMDMTGYDSQCRQRMTAFSLANLSAYEEVHMVLRSKIVAMGVQVANLALRGKIHVHTSRARLDVELRRMMKMVPASMPPAKAAGLR